jgi:hypothetical protein
LFIIIIIIIIIIIMYPTKRRQGSYESPCESTVQSENIDPHCHAGSADMPTSSVSLNEQLEGQSFA